MDMPRTSEQLQQAADAAERWLDSLDPAAIASPGADASRLRRIGDAVRAVAKGQVELADAVAEARVHGHTWTQIAAMLGTSRQAAQERYGELAERPSMSPPTLTAEVESASDAREPGRPVSVGRRKERVTGKKDASLAGKQRASKSATKAQKSVAASDLAQSKAKGKGKK